MERKVIDVSKHNGVIDWAKVAADGVDGAIIRAGYGKVASQKDPCFEDNYSGAKAAGLNVGAYWYSYATTVDDAKTEAAVFIDCIKGKQFGLPVYLDIEDKTQVALGKSLCTGIAVAFMTALENAGYFAGVYSYDSFFATNLEETLRKRYAVWVARVENVTPTYATEWGMHQYSWKGTIDGISGDVDLNRCIKDYPTIIKNAGLNGYSAASSAGYSVTAKISDCAEAQASTIAAACSQMGMTAVVSEGG
ncbi:MAG: glycoside hydrolase family 25 protein [Oscillospiraceae bacterium]|nr:glycoside hydrolase family 25 protein [Oscillospiraceae bacterium]